MLDVFHTNYTLNDEFKTKYRGLTYKRQMIDEQVNLEAVTICFRMQMDFFTSIGNYIEIIEMKDGYQTNNGKDKGDRVVEFKIRWYLP